MASFLVTTTSDVVDPDDALVSLREAINLANAEPGLDSITFDPAALLASIRIELSLGALHITDSLRVTGPGMNRLTIDGGGNSRIMLMESDASDDLILQGLSLRGGLSSADADTDEAPRGAGGAIRFNSSGTLTVAHSSIVDSQTVGDGAHGGAIFSNLGNVVLDSAQLLRNSTAGVQAAGGAVFVSPGALLIQDSDLRDNRTLGRGSQGGAVFSSGAVASIRTSRLVNNSTAGDSADGGAVFSDGGLSLTASVISGNSTAGEDADGGGLFTSTYLAVDQSDLSGNRTLGDASAGGAVVVDSATVFVRNSSITNNETLGDIGHGGGVLAVRSVVSISGSTISQNRASGAQADGGGVASLLSTVSINGSTITGNQASATGGGVSFVEVNGGMLTIENAILAENSAGSGAPDLFVDASPQSLSIQFSLLGDRNGSGLDESVTQDANGNFIGDPAGQGMIDPGLQPLSRVGITWIHPLELTSPARNAGNNLLAMTVENDQRGAPFMRIDNQTVDMGAFEIQSVSGSLLIVTTADDELDFSNNLVSLREAIQVANGIVGPATIGFDAVALGERLTLTPQLGEWLITDSLTIEADPDRSITFDGLNHSRLFTVSEGTSDVTFRNLTLQNGRTTSEQSGGAAVQFFSSGTITLDHSRVRDNHTFGSNSPGGGVHSPHGHVVLERTELVANTTSGDASGGGGIFAGGGITSYQSLLSANQTLGSQSPGGGILLSTAGDASFTASSLIDNAARGAGSRGGGVAASGVDVAISSSTISGNTAASDGGGVSFASAQSNQLTMEFATIAYNESGEVGGGVSVVDGITPLVTIRNSIIANNQDAGSAPDLGVGLSPGSFQFESSLLGNNVGTMLAGSSTPDANGNLIGDAAGAGLMNPRLAPLASRGGPTPSHALLEGSPAIDAGEQLANPTVESDQRGAPFVRLFGDAPDMGAYESQSLNVDTYFTVTTIADELNFENDSVSLREAIEYSSGSLGIQTIRFDATVFSQPQTIALELGELVISDSIDILGPGPARLQIDAGGMSRVVRVSSEAAEVLVRGITITGGFSGGSEFELGLDSFSPNSGGGIRVDSLGRIELDEVALTNNVTDGESAHGGGLFAPQANVTIRASVVSGNRTLGQGAHGGGIYTGGAATLITHSTVSNNSTRGDAAHGGGLRINGPTATIINATLSGNVVIGLDAHGGGVDIARGSDLQVTQSTITLNESQAGGGGIYVGEGSVSALALANSIVAGNSDAAIVPDLHPPLNPDNFSIRFTLIGDNAGTSLAESPTADPQGNLIGSSSGLGRLDARLTPLSIHGGTTPTHKPLSTSPAINAGDNDLALDELEQPLVNDQRGSPFARNVSSVDLGAFETQPPVMPIIEWPTPENIFVGTALSLTQLNATTNTSGTFVYTPALGTVLPLGDAQVLSVDFMPDDRLHYAATTASVLISIVEQSDLGDAPDTYQTLRESGGPRHFVGSLFLGDVVDAETNASPGVDASGDGPDEDGVDWMTSLVADPVVSTLATVGVVASARSQIDAWIDFNGNGVFDHPEEHLGGGTSITVFAGSNRISVEVPAGASSGLSYARFRLSAVGGLLPTGPADDGEVEDYTVWILDGTADPTVQIRLPQGPLTLVSDSGQLVASRSGQTLFRAPLESVGRVELAGDESSNVVTIDSQFGNVIPVGGLAFDGDEPVNTLRLISANQTYDFTQTGNMQLRNIDVIDTSGPGVQILRFDAAAVRAMDPTGGGVVIVGSSSDAIQFADGALWRMAAPLSLLGFSFSKVRLADTFVQVDFASPWLNLAQSGDVNNDGEVTAGDALRVINELAIRQYSAADSGELVDPSSISIWPHLYLDENGDGTATALDALRIINEIARRSNQLAGPEIASLKEIVLNLQIAPPPAGDQVFLSYSADDELAYLSSHQSGDSTVADERVSRASFSPRWESNSRQESTALDMYSPVDSVFEQLGRDDLSRDRLESELPSPPRRQQS